MAALDRKAVAMGLKPSVLARNLVRIGLHAGNNQDVALALSRLDAAVEELRALVA
jgi:hypothetical protein